MQKDHMWGENVCILDVLDYRIIQSRAKVYKRSLNKPYENEVTLRGQNPPLKCCQDLEILTLFEKGLDL